VPTWAGWAGQLLTRLGYKQTAANVKFLDDWAAANGSTCRNNVLETTATWAGSTLCDDFGAQAYKSHANGIDATAKQLHETRFGAILAALKSGNPYGVSDYQKVADELNTWGATNFSGQYLNQVKPQAPPTSAIAPDTNRGFNRVRHAINHTLPDTLKHSQALGAEALRMMIKARKVYP